MKKTKINSSIKSLPVGYMHLPLRAFNALESSKILTIGDLLNLEHSEIRNIRNLGSKYQEQIIDALNLLIVSIDENGDADWNKYWEDINVSVIPQSYIPNASPAQIISGLPALIQEILLCDFDEHVWVIVQRRYQLGNVDKLTLNELGIAFSMTRERIRQLENQAIANLYNVLIDYQYSGKCYHVHPEIQETLRGLAEFVIAETKHPILENSLLSSIRNRFGIETETVKYSLFLVFALCRVARIEFNNDLLDPLWGPFEKSQEKQIQNTILSLHQLLTQEVATPVSEVDILIKLNKNQKENRKLSLAQLRDYANLCNTVEQHSDGFYWGKFEYLGKRGNQVERILIERGESVHLSEIVRELNHRLALQGKRMVNIRTLGNQISVDGRFCPIGKSGEWGLTSWSLDTGTIIDLMKQALIVQNKPVSADEIYNYVSERRPVNRSSIEAYLTFRDDFVKIDRTKWSLASWSESNDAKVWNPEQVGNFVESVFHENRAQVLEYHMLRQALMEAAEINNRQAQGLLNTTPVIRTHRDKDNVLIATFQTDWKNQLAQKGAGFARKKKTLRDKVDDVVREILKNAPGNQVALSKLIAMLQKNFGRRTKNFDKTLYQYIAQLEYVEKFTLPDTSVKMCRLKKEQTVSLISQIESISSPELMKKIGRALTFLTESDVDIALFLLSKEFEATLADYLDYANQMKKLVSNLPPNLNLDGMINFVKKEGIITDQAVLHFLRQKRNDRAHGTMPTLDERHMMMKYSQTTAAMYVDYIKFFDDLKNSI